MRKVKSFSRRLSLYIVGITSVIFLGAMAILAIYSHKLITEEAMSSASNMLAATINDLEKTLEVAEVTTEDISWLLTDHVFNERYLYDMTRKVVSQSSIISGAAIAFPKGEFQGRYYFSPYSYRDSNGEVHSKQLGNEDYDYFSMDWFRVPFETKQCCWTEPYFDEGGGGVLMSTFSRPLLDSNGNVLAIITADISLEQMSEKTNSIRPYKHSFTLLVSKEGQFIGHPYSDEMGKNIFDEPELKENEVLRKIVTSMLDGNSGIKSFALDRDISFASFGPLNNGWSVAIICPYRSVLERSTVMHIIIGFVFGFGLILLFVVCYFVVKHLTQPLTEISKSAESIATGNFNTKLPRIKSHDELRQLRDSFDYMQTSLVKYVDELKTTTAANERFESELNIAHDIQQSMLPQNFPQCDEVDLHALLIPAKEVGGDLYDFIYRTSDDVLCLAIGDVSGKGVPASMFMAITRSACRFMSGLNFSLAQKMERINESISDNNNMGMFVTLFHACLHLKTGLFQFCNAGHNPIILVKPDGTAEFLKEKVNLAVGLIPDFKYEMQEVQIEKGSKLILYTDGVTEAEDKDKNLFGEERLLQWASKPEAFETAQTACDDLLKTVREFTGPVDQNDDITIMIIKY